MSGQREHHQRAARPSWRRAPLR